MAKKLSKRDYYRIASRARRRIPMRQIMEQTGIGSGTVGPVLVHLGARKSSPEIRAHESARVERWLAAR